MNAVKDHPNETCDTNALRSLLRCELAAVETYDHALKQFEDQHALADLEKIREEHAHAVVQLRDKISQYGGEQVESPGPWSCFEATSRGVASNTLGFAALKQGEEHVMNEFEVALNNEAVNPLCKDLIRAELIPHSKEHVEKLDRLMGGMA
jgi:hypothetical protein